MNRHEELALLSEGARSFDLILETGQAEDLLKLVDGLERANAEFNLTAIRDRPGMLLKHVLDSLSVQPYLRGGRIADVGTGAGFPGLPLAIVNPERRFTLIEATGKKARYVHQTAELLGLANVEVENVRAELYRPPHAVRLGGCARALVVGQFRRLCGTSMCAGWAAPGHERQAPRPGNRRAAEVVPPGSRA